MAYVTSVKHYTNACDKPDCLTLNSPARVFFRAGATTTDGQPFIDGTITNIAQRSDGGYDVSFRYVTATIRPGFIVTFPTAISSGNVCDPDCMSECSWLWKVQKVADGVNQAALINRSYLLINSATHLANATYYIPRMPFALGLNLTSVKLTCHKYDHGTSATFTLRYRTTADAATPDASLPICGVYSGNLDSQKPITISVPVIPYDAELVLTITGTTQSVYVNSTLGLTLELLGFMVAT